MDTLFGEGYSTSMNDFKLNPNSISSCSNRIINGFKFQQFNFPDSETVEYQTDPGSSKSSPPSSGGESPVENDQNLEVLKYINEMLMEEDLHNQNCMFQDCMALQAAHKSFYDILNDAPDPDGQKIASSGSDLSTESNWVADFDEFRIPDEQVTNPGTDFESVLQSYTAVLHSSANPSELVKGRKNRARDCGDFKEPLRMNKQSAIFSDEHEDLEMFDKVLLCNGEEKVKKLVQQNGRTNRNKTEMVDLRSILTHCAQAVASSDRKTATLLLTQIRQHSSAFGDGTQRLAHYFADGLEARLLGTHTQLQIVIAKRTPAAEILKAYQVYVTACPFKQMSNIYSNRTILKHTEKSTSIHIIDFGILYGFQWPCFIQGLAKRPGGPPRLKITGIELPQPGFRPSERVEETGRRLMKYCKRFNIPFEFKAIAKKWEAIKLEDLKIEKDERVFVNCIHRLENLPDDTIVSSSPRDKVLKLIKNINPYMFIHGVSNGTYNAPFFLTRFREALFHFSALFDMFEATIPTEDEDRLMFEKEIFGRDAINTIACEGLERTDRPETYKQWKARNVRAGFRQVGLDEDIFKLVRSKVKTGYHKEFVVDENGGWMLQGWKGRIIYALSCWVPAY